MPDYTYEEITRAYTFNKEEVEEKKEAVEEKKEAVEEKKEVVNVTEDHGADPSNVATSVEVSTSSPSEECKETVEKVTDISTSM